MRDAFETAYGGETVGFRPPCAMQELTLSARAAEVLPLLANLGMEGRAGTALAHNCVMLAQTLEGEHACETGEAVLHRFSLREIAGLAESYMEHWDLPFDADRCG